MLVKTNQKKTCRYDMLVITLMVTTLQNKGLRFTRKSETKERKIKHSQKSSGRSK